MEATIMSGRESQPRYELDPSVSGVSEEIFEINEGWAKMVETPMNKPLGLYPRV